MASKFITFILTLLISWASTIRPTKTDCLCNSGILCSVEVGFNTMFLIYHKSIRLFIGMFLGVLSENPFCNSIFLSVDIFSIFPCSIIIKLKALLCGWRLRGLSRVDSPFKLVDLNVSSQRIMNLLNQNCVSLSS